MRLLLLAILLLLPAAHSQIAVQLRGGVKNVEKKAEGRPLTSLPVDRRTERMMNAARKAFEAEEWARFMEFARRLLDIQTESFFEAKDGAFQPVRAEILRLLYSLGPEERKLYIAQYAAAASHQLSRARQENDFEAILEVASRYPMTDSGWEAAEFAAMIFLDQGRLAVAAAMLQELAARPDFKERNRPEILIKLASAYATMGDMPLAKAALEGMSSNAGHSRIRVGGESLAPGSYLELLSSVKHPGNRPNESGFQSFLGVPHPDTNSQGSPPFAESVWQVPITREKKFNWQSWGGTVEGKQTAGTAPLPSIHPIAYDGRVIAKTFDGLAAYNAETGKVVWKEAGKTGRLSEAFSRILNKPTQQNRAHYRQNNMLQMTQTFAFADTLQFSLTAGDGRVFSVDTIFQQQGRNRFTVLNAWSLMRMTSGNSLRAFDASGGKLLWEINGLARLDDEKMELDGAYFLGAPALYEGKLYIMADLGSEMFLVSIDPSNGKQFARIPLCVTSGPPNSVFHRTRDACPVTVSGGVFYCPTQFGRFFAVDAVTNRLLWNFDYPNSVTEKSPRHRYSTINLNEVRPAVSAPLLQGRYLLFLPTDSAKLFCLNRISGEKIWEAPATSRSFLACKGKGKVLVIGDEAAIYDIATGKQIVRHTPGAAIGRGVKLGDTYIYPIKDQEFRRPEMSGNRVARIDLKTGKMKMLTQPTWIANPKTQQWSMGNFVAYKNRIISASPMGVVSFPMSGEEIERVETEIAKHGENAGRLLQRAKLRLSLGDTEKGLLDLRNALKISANAAAKEKVRPLLFRALLLSSMAGDKYTSAQLAEAGTLAKSEEEQRFYLLKLGQHERRIGNMSAAIDAFRSYAKKGGEEFMLVDDNHGLRVLSGPWLAAQLRDVWLSGEPEEKKKLASQLVTELKTAPQTAEGLQKYLNTYGELPGQEENWLKLAGMWESGENWTNAEMLYLRFQNSERDEVAAECLVRLMQLSKRMNLLEDEVHFARKINERFPKLKLGDGRVPAELAAPALARASEKKSPVKPVEAYDVKIGKFQKHSRYVGRNPLLIGTRALPSFDRWRVFWNSQWKIQFEHEGKEWSQQIERVNYRHTPGKAQFRGYYGNWVYSLGHRLYCAYQGTLICASPLQKKSIWKRSYKDDWNKKSAQIHSGQMLSTSVFPDGGIRIGGSYYNNSLQRMVRLIGVSPRGLLCVDTRFLLALSPETGKPLWYRPIKAPTNTYIFQSGSHVCELLPTGYLNLYRLSDGTFEKRTKLKAFVSSNGMLYQGNFISGITSGKKVKLRMLSPQSDRVVWESELPSAGTFFRASRRELGLLGKDSLSIISLDTGKKTLEMKFPKLKGIPYNVYAWRSGTRILMCVPDQVMPNLNALQTLQRAMNYHFANGYSVRGRLMCFDTASSKLMWQEQFDQKLNGYIMRSQYDESPVLVMRQHVYTEKKIKNRTSRHVTGYKVRVINKHNGKTILEHKLDRTQSPHLLSEKPGEIKMRTSQGMIPLTYKTRPVSGEKKKEK
ncbi:MAG: PQQ-binding-like beta-propeller repeat protein [Planctomycetota bacterium]|nr:PQQ-binding-like beta-propeller repeat protein [Planctomycetota bacterium]